MDAVQAPGGGGGVWGRGELGVIAGDINILIGCWRRRLCISPCSEVGGRGSSGAQVWDEDRTRELSPPPTYHPPAPA